MSAGSVKVTVVVTSGGETTKSEYECKGVPEEVLRPVHEIASSGDCDFSGPEGPAGTMATDMVTTLAQLKLEAMLKQLPPELLEKLAGVAASVGVSLSSPPAQA